MKPITKVRVLGFRLGLVILAGYWLVLFVGTHLTHVPKAIGRHSDKLLHSGAYFGLGLLLCYVTSGTKLWRRFGRVLLIGAAYGVIDEVTQGFVPGRISDLRDWYADVGGISVAILLYISIRAVARRVSPLNREGNESPQALTDT